MPLASEQAPGPAGWAEAVDAERVASSPSLPAGRRRMVAGLLACSLTLAAGALTAAPASPSAPSAPSTQPWLKGIAQALAAHFRVRQLPSGPMQDWYFYRQADSLHLIKPKHEEVWRLSAQGQISFERYFLADRRSVHYSPGELLTLGLRPEWPALQRFADLAAWRAQPDDTPGQWRLTLGGDSPSKPTQEALWSEALQLPLWITRRSGNASGTLEWRLISHHPAPLPSWPRPDGAGRNLEQVDAADLGDLLDKDFTAKAERMDVLNGWRAAHEH